jgi:hypothetical protein
LGGFVRIAFHEDQRNCAQRFLLAEEHTHSFTVGGESGKVDQDGLRWILADAAESLGPEAKVWSRVKTQRAQSRRPFDRFRRVPVNDQDADHRSYARTTPDTGSRRLRI